MKHRRVKTVGPQRIPDEPTSTADGPRPATGGDPRGGRPMSDGSGSKVRTYISYLFAVVFAVVVVGMLILLAQVIIDAA